MSQHRSIVCTLTAAERIARGTSWHEIVRTAVCAIDEREDGYVLTITSDSATFDKLRDLVESERRCCQWMTLELQEGSPASLRIAAESAEGKAAIRTMLIQEEASC